MKIDIYSDGSATTGKPGGYGWLIAIDGMKYSEGSGYSPNATNNDMELESALQGLEALDKLGGPFIGEQLALSQDPLTLYINLVSDSQIVLGWADGTYKFKQIDKIDKYHRLKALVAKYKVETVWVKGHSGNEFNERCDKLAGLARKQLVEELAPKPDPNLTKIGNKRTDTASVWYKGALRVVDFSSGIVETYNKDLHGKRGSVIEIRENKDR